MICSYKNPANTGGMGTRIFKGLFDIDYVIYVKKNNDSNDKRLFKYDVSSSVEEIKEGAKTKYYPVEISEVMDIVKSKPGRYAVIGIPSFIYSIRLLAEADETINERIKYTVGLVCGHQKSSKFAESMAWQVGIQPGNLVDIDFRHKLLDRPASNYAVKMTEYTAEYTSLYRMLSRKTLLKRIVRMGPKQFASKVIDRIIRR